MPAELFTYDWKTLFFANAPVKIGITTSLFGDCSFQNEQLEQAQSQRLCDDLRCDCYHKLRVEHGDAITILSNQVCCHHENYYYPCDALIRVNRGGDHKLLLSNTADCPIIALCDNEHRVQAIVHSGWRSTATNIVGKTIKAIADTSEVKAWQLQAYLWPGISGQYYQVGPEVLALFPGHTQGNRLYLREAIIDQLLQAGLSRNHIIAPEIFSDFVDDRHQVRMYSHRLEHTAKRNMMFISSPGRAS